MMYVVAENLQFDLNFESRFGLRISELKLPRVSWNALANSSPLFGQFIQRVMNALRTAARRCAHASLFLIRPPSSRMHTTAYAPPPAAPAGTAAALHPHAHTRHHRLLVVIGPTGAGKSRAAIDLAAALDGEVVNADVMQMYRGLDVATAKVPVPDRRGVPHHLMSFLDPRTTFSVRAFAAMSRAAIDDIAARGKLPVVVGGTMYYVQCLLRDSLLEADEEQAAEAVAYSKAAANVMSSDVEMAPTVASVPSHIRATHGMLATAIPSSLSADLSMGGTATCYDYAATHPSLGGVSNLSGSGSYTSATIGANVPFSSTSATPGIGSAHSSTTTSLDRPTDTLPVELISPTRITTPFDRLRVVDPIMAQRLHERDTRKIARALEVFDTTGVPYSTLIQAQQMRLNRNTKSGAVEVSSLATAPSLVSPTSAAAVVGDSTSAETSTSSLSETTMAPVPSFSASAAAPRDASTSLTSTAPLPSAAYSSSPYDAFVLHLDVSNAAELDARLETRVDDMMSGGLLREIQQLREYLREVNSPANVERHQQHRECLVPSELLTHRPQLQIGTDAPTGHTFQLGTDAPTEQLMHPLLQLGADVPSELTHRVARGYYARNATAEAARTTTLTGSTVAVPAVATTATAYAASAAATSTTANIHTGAAPPPPSTSLPHGGTPTSTSEGYGGLLQAIGYKEFSSYLALLDGTPNEGIIVDSKSAASTFTQPATASTSTESVRVSRKRTHRSASTSPTYISRTAADFSVGTAAAAHSSSSTSAATSTTATRHTLPSEASISTVLARCVTHMKDVTRQYARKQRRWIRNRFVKQGVGMLSIDTGGQLQLGSNSSVSVGAGSGPAAVKEAPTSTWELRVATPALAAVSSWLRHGVIDSTFSTGSSSAVRYLSASGPSSSTSVSTVVTASDGATTSAGADMMQQSNSSSSGSNSSAPLQLAPRAAPKHAEAHHLTPDAARLFSWRKYTCDVCGGRTVNGDTEWSAHLRSRAHAGAVKYEERRRVLKAERGIDLPSRVVVSGGS